MADYFDNVTYEEELEIRDIAIDESNIDKMFSVMPLPEAKDYAVRVMVPIHNRVGVLNEVRYKLWTFLETHSTNVYSHSGVFITSKNALADEDKLKYDHRIWSECDVTVSFDEDYIDCGFNHGFDIIQFFEYLKMLYDSIFEGLPEMLIYYSNGNYWKRLHCLQDGTHAVLINCDKVLKFLKNPPGRSWCMTYEESILLNTAQFIIKDDAAVKQLLESSGMRLPAVADLPADLKGKRNEITEDDMQNGGYSVADALNGFSISYSDTVINECFSLLIYPASRVYYGDNAHLYDENEKRKVFRRISGGKRLKVKNVQTIRSKYSTVPDEHRKIYHYGVVLSLGTYPLKNDNGEIFDFVKVYVVCCFNSGWNSRGLLLNKKGEKIEKLCYECVPKEYRIRPVLVSDAVLENTFGPDWNKPIYTEQPSLSKNRY